MAHIPENLNLVALRKYACVTADKNNEWYLSCVNCEKSEMCETGKRVTDILDKQTKPEKSQIEKFEDRLMKKKQMELDATMREALKHPHPAEWLIEHGYYGGNKKNATNALSRWRVKNRCANPVRQKAGNNTNNSDVSAEPARERIVQIFDGQKKEDCLKRFLQIGLSPEAKASTAMAKAYYWAKRYPDLADKYPIKEMGRELCHAPLNNAGTVKEALDMLEKKDIPAEEDEVELGDFMKELAIDVKPKEGAPDIKPIIAGSTKGPVVVEKVPERKVPPISDDQQSTLLAEFNRKKAELRNGINLANQKIHELMALIDKFQHEEKVLDEAAKIFGMAPKQKGATA